MARPKPTDEQIQQMFWDNIRRDYNDLGLMDAGIIPMHPDVEKNVKNGFRLTFFCLDCPDKHSVHGDYQDIGMAVQVLVLRGIKSVTIEETHFAAERDAAKAEAMIAVGNVPDLLSQVLGKKP